MNGTIDFSKIDKRWTLFLDRDGVINIEKENDYIYHWDEFVFYDDVLPVLKKFNELFNHIIIVTNQRGVSKGLMTEADLQQIHENMTAAIQAAGGRIDRIYYCTDMENASPRRKPSPTMGLEAQHDFPDIDFSKAVMIGNTLSDMHFGRNLGMQTIYLRTTHPDIRLPNSLIDAAFDNLGSVANALNRTIL